MTARKPIGLKEHDAIVAERDNTIRQLRHEKEMADMQAQHYERMMKSADSAATQFSSIATQLGDTLLTVTEERNALRKRLDDIDTTIGNALARRSHVSQG